MTDLKPLFPRQATPILKLALAGGREFDLSRSAPPAFTMLVFYRGLHCPICKSQLKDLEAKLSDFEQRGVEVVAISSDPKERAEQAKNEWGLSSLEVAYGLDLKAARDWGLYVSAAREGTDEPAYFSEPAIYLIRPDGTLYFGSVQTMPFARPHFDEILKAIDFVVAKNYPARGEVVSLR